MENLAAQATSLFVVITEITYVSRWLAKANSTTTNPVELRQAHALLDGWIHPVISWQLV